MSLCAVLRGGGILTGRNAEQFVTSCGIELVVKRVKSPSAHGPGLVLSAGLAITTLLCFQLLTCQLGLRLAGTLLLYCTFPLYNIQVPNECLWLKGNFQPP